MEYAGVKTCASCGNLFTNNSFYFPIGQMGKCRTCVTTNSKPSCRGCIFDNPIPNDTTCMYCKVDRKYLR